MGGFLLARVTDTDNPLDPTFPSPLEVWVGSYVLATVATIATLGVSVPSRGMGGFLLKSLDLKQRPLLKVSVPSRGMGGFLRT